MTDDKLRPSRQALVSRLELILAAHLAEYAALTNRCTYWIAIQFAVWPVIGGWLALAASLWHTAPRAALVWTCAAGVQLLLLGWNLTLREIYIAVRYIERELKPAVHTLIGEVRFWHYETYNALQRGSLPAWWEFATPAASFVALIALVVLQPMDDADAVGLAVNSLLLACAILETTSILQIRRGFFLSPPSILHVGS